MHEYGLRKIEFKLRTQGAHSCSVINKGEFLRLLIKFSLFPFQVRSPTPLASEKSVSFQVSRKVWSKEHFSTKSENVAYFFLIEKCDDFLWKVSKTFAISSKTFAIPALDKSSTCHTDKFELQSQARLEVRKLRLAEIITGRSTTSIEVILSFEAFSDWRIPTKAFATKSFRPKVLPKKNQNAYFAPFCFFNQETSLTSGFWLLKTNFLASQVLPFVLM